MNRGKEVTSPLQVSGSSSVKWDGKLPTSCQKDKWAKHLALSIEFSCSYSDDYSFYTFIWIQNLWEKINISTKGNEKGGFSSVYYSYFCVPKHCRREQDVNTSWEGGCQKEIEQLVYFHLRKKSMWTLHSFEPNFISFLWTMNIYNVQQAEDPGFPTRSASLAC